MVALILVLNFMTGKIALHCGIESQFGRLYSLGPRLTVIHPGFTSHLGFDEYVLPLIYNTGKTNVRRVRGG